MPACRLIPLHQYVDEPSLQIIDGQAHGRLLRQGVAYACRRVERVRIVGLKHEIERNLGVVFGGGSCAGDARTLQLGNPLNPGLESGVGGLAQARVGEIEVRQIF